MQHCITNLPAVSIHAKRMPSNCAGVTEHSNTYKNTRHPHHFFVRGQPLDMRFSSISSCASSQCKFYEPRTTLVDGYCDGGACEFNGKPWAAKLKNQLSF